MDQFPVLKRMADAIYGEVLLCRDAVMFDIVAVKKIYMHRAARRHSDVHKHAVHEDVLFELDVNQRVQLAGGHPHICRLRHHFTYVDTAMSHPILAMVFDYCPHGELLTTLSASKRFTELVALRYVAQIAQAIDFLHLLHIAHRDISLENILLDGAHRAKLCDFGLACDDRMVKTEPVGKLLYMAPEVLAGEEYAPAQADMWSLGVALFTMVVGHYPFHEASMHDPFYSVFARVGLSSLLRKHGVGHISVELQSLLEKLLHVNPDQRIQCQHLLAHPLVEPFVDDDADTTSFSTVSLEDERSSRAMDSPNNSNHHPDEEGKPKTSAELSNKQPCHASSAMAIRSPEFVERYPHSTASSLPMRPLHPFRPASTVVDNNNIHLKGSFKAFWKQQVLSIRKRWGGKVAV
ncbi:hypothetical protein DYB38_006693 [Aphanomyces astaci]|uniref:Protein kinase domain-containing protein n=1 Tax=Aphanomyces astaci TaxID=112090 RepID=A0A397CR43_APHAT|nr:hypothetical protein DYB38_006693 [Aphanomyces astaci]